MPRASGTIGYYGPDLTGRTLREVTLDDEREVLTLRFTDGTERYRTHGDCCSETWVEHLTVPDLTGGARVLRVTESGGVDATPEQKAKSDAEREYGTDCLTVYQTSIVTDRGEVVIEYRNDSNGYYGGSLDHSASVPVVIDGDAIEVTPEARRLA